MTTKIRLTIKFECEVDKTNLYDLLEKLREEGDAEVESVVVVETPKPEIQP